MAEEKKKSEKKEQEDYRVPSHVFEFPVPQANIPNVEAHVQGREEATPVVKAESKKEEKSVAVEDDEEE